MILSFYKPELFFLFYLQYRTYKVKKGPGSFYPFVFNDVMGLSEETEVLEEDIKLVLRGHVKEGYTVNQRNDCDII